MLRWFKDEVPKGWKEVDPLKHVSAKDAARYGRGGSKLGFKSDDVKPEEEKPKKVKKAKSAR